MQAPRIERKRDALEITVPEDRLPAMREFLTRGNADSVKALGIVLHEYPTLIGQAESSGSSLKGLLKAAKAYAESIRIVGDPSRRYDEKLNQGVEDIPVALKGDKTGLGFLGGPPRKKPETKTENPQAMEYPQTEKAFEHEKSKQKTPQVKQQLKPKIKETKRPEYADQVEAILDRVEARGGNKPVMAEALLAQLAKQKSWETHEMRKYLLGIMKPEDKQEYKKFVGLKEQK
ncbi:MAG: hypothetical protein GF334_00850 [Candidatus Altiarchaeales archaeon]|nr:hypothetical protein [Candidatus Altiarchaeales archaeon]